jgi:Ran GTPase-activating protein (RanGAP) involved in mRNA processing and transport
LGNNIVGDGGALSIAKHIVKPTSHLDTWYIAGNEFTELGIAAVADALATNTKVRALWLKRNPLKVGGCIPLARMLQLNTLIEVLDLVNCGILDEGVNIIFDALRVNRTLRHLYIGTNGLTEAAGERIGQHFAEGKNELHSLYVSCNRMGDRGMLAMARGLAVDRTLQRLSVASNRIGADGCRALTDALARHPSLLLFDIGFTRATSAVGELGNRIEDLGAAHIADLLRTNNVIRSLDILHNSIGQVGLNHLRDAMKLNTSLTTLNFTQFGKVHNEVGKEELRAAVDRNRLAAGPLLLSQLSKIDTPEHISEIYSVYRTH